MNDTFTTKHAKKLMTVLQENEQHDPFPFTITYKELIMSECKIKPCYVVNDDDSFKFVGYIIRVNDRIEDNTIYLDYETAYEYAKEKGYEVT